MSPEEWKGSNIDETNRVLILGESHYDDDDDSIGKPVSFSTSSVVKTYLAHCRPDGGSAKWDRFFDRIAESFGYSRDKSAVFYEKIWFGNYAPVLCGKGSTNKAEHFMKESRTDYNNSLFSFVNRNSISVIVCFSKAVFWNLPDAADMDRDSYKEINLPSLGGRGNNINVYEYEPLVSHGACEVVLSKRLKVYGIRHPSARGGFASRPVYAALSKEESLRGICI